MNKILMAGLFAFFGWMTISSAYAVEGQSVAKENCHVSFTAPAFLEYVEIPDDIYLGNTVCHLPFTFTGPLKWKHGDTPGLLEEWRALTDFSVTIERLPLTEALKKIEAPDGGAQSGRFTLISKKQTKLSSGDLYTLTFNATKPMKSTRSLETNALTIFVLGDGKYSATFYAYPWGKDPKRLMRQRAYQDLFSSFSFLPECQAKDNQP
ncbi:hypothetical protein [Paraburkholderia nodosa]|uniref:hypothetical protein n=1 Tax=Paraburkholderia nodosa TaxID=392320 RepID=UPI0012B697C0|nr:hypothetical protein [Paraburkholderia nodosa]